MSFQSQRPNPRVKTAVRPLLSLGLILCVSWDISAAEQQSWKLDFGGAVAPGYTAVPPDSVFSADAGFGFEKGLSVTTAATENTDASRDGFVTSDKPFLFSVSVPEGVYRVTVVLGDGQGASVTTVKAEARRLMVEKVETAQGRVETRSFNVAVRRPDLKAGEKVLLKPVELEGHRDWDHKLTLEFSNRRPCLCAVEITPARDFTTIYIAGDSTVTNQRSEPYAGWGQMLPRFFTDAVSVSNHAHSGLALKSFAGGKRLAKILTTIQKGDYLFIQFGHNDQKSKSPGDGPFTSYKASLKQFIAAARSKEAIPVLVTPMERRRFDNDGKQAVTLADYAEAVRQVGAEDKVSVIDLNAMSLKFYAALGPDNSTKAFVHYPAKTFPGQEKPLKDNTHHNAYGAYELARCVVEDIKAHLPELAAHLTKDTAPFDPSHPDAPESVAVPASPVTDVVEKPAGS